MPTEISPILERLRPHRLAIGTVTVLVALAIALTWVAWRWGVAEDRLAMLQAEADAGFLQAPTTSRSVHIDLRAPGQVTVGGGELPERVDLHVNARTPRFTRFRASLLREDGTLIFHADHLVRDSNLDLRLSLNSSLLPSGEYVLRVEGYGPGGKPEAFAEASLRAR
jgi:hypothetical protein